MTKGKTKDQKQLPDANVNLRPDVKAGSSQQTGLRQKARTSAAQFGSTPKASRSKEIKGQTGSLANAATN